MLGLLWALVLGMGPGPVAAEGPGPERVCSVAPAAEGCDPGQVCDAVRNTCVAACEGADCCEGVVCPAGSACVPDRGTCGIPAGESCFDLGASWSTASHIEAEAEPAQTPRPVDVVLLNRTGAPLYFQASTASARPRFDLYARFSPAKRRLEIPENQFCPIWCPAEGPVPERDCARPDPAVVRLADGGGLRLAWSGLEAVTTVRSCASQGLRSCLSERATRPGLYEVEVCGHGEVEADDVADTEATIIAGARVAGPERCLRETFEYPGQHEMRLTFGG